MSKAEDLAYKAYPYNGDYRGQGDSNSKFREAYVNGYNQAEKDLALTWEDIEQIQEIANSYTKHHSMEPRIFVYKEVLNRFNKQKGK